MLLLVRLSENISLEENEKTEALKLFEDFNKHFEKRSDPESIMTYIAWNFARFLQRYVSSQEVGREDIRESNDFFAGKFPELVEKLHNKKKDDDFRNFLLGTCDLTIAFVKAFKKLKDSGQTDFVVLNPSPSSNS